MSFEFPTVIEKTKLRAKMLWENIFSLRNKNKNASRRPRSCGLAVDDVCGQGRWGPDMQPLAPPWALELTAITLSI